MTRRQLARFGAPAAFLLGVTVAVLLVRAGLDSGAAGTRTSTRGPVTHAATAPAPATTAATTTAATTAATETGSAGQRFVTVQKGDTFFSIATKAGISVADVEALNPGVSSNALRVGQKIRIK